MADTILAVHSAGPQGPGEGSDPLVRRLREELGPEYEVRFPKMPGTEEPRYEPWRDRLSSEIAKQKDSLILLGHSLGGSVALKYLSEKRMEDPIAGLVSLATPFWGTSDWEREWVLPEGWPAEGSQLPPTFLFHSRDDEEIPVAHLDLYTRRLPEAKARTLDGSGHLFDKGDLSEIVAAVRSL
jgi:predicted alpha/beta hydrolase family esterase